ncbi:hypothetical protein N0V95_001757 [Ascochyta clinopodiicola]|nr:hypothetical protein N0V95_001757 [Ascochyta clinopodiicola]
MKLLTLTLFTLLSLVIEIAANNESIGSEVLYFYYVYKMQYMSGGAKTIATACKSSGETGMCYFDDFVKHIMEESYVQQYRPKTGDHTKTPSQSNLATFKQAITQQSVSYRMDRLDPHLQNAAGGDVAGAARSQAALLETILESANNAIDSGNALITDAESAHEAIEDAMQKRSPQAMNAVDNWLARELTEDEQGHVSKTGAIVNWKETLDNVDLAVESDELTHDQGEALKTRMTTISGQFGRDLTDVPVSDITHLSILRTLQDSSTQIKTGVDRGDTEVDDKIPPPPEPVSSCSSSDYDSSSSGSELKRRGTNQFVAKLFKFAKRQPDALAKLLEARQLQPLSKYFDAFRPSPVVVVVFKIFVTIVYRVQ